MHGLLGSGPDSVTQMLGGGGVGGGGVGGGGEGPPTSGQLEEQNPQLP